MEQMADPLTYLAPIEGVRQIVATGSRARKTFPQP